MRYTSFDLFLLFIGIYVFTSPRSYRELICIIHVVKACMMSRRCIYGSKCVLVYIVHWCIVNQILFVIQDSTEGGVLFTTTEIHSRGS